MDNDLISREALKENGTVIGMVNGQKMKVVPLSAIDNAPTIEIATKLQPNCNNLQQTQGDIIKAYTKGFDTGVETVKGERPQGERAERALSIIDRLRTDGHINNKEQGTLRRAILLPEKPQGDLADEVCCRS